MKKILQSRDTAQEISPPSAPTFGRSISTNDVKDGKLALTDKAFVLRFAGDSDYQAFREILEAKLATKPQGWRELPGGIKIPADRVLMLCTKCRAAIWLDAESGGHACLACNIMNYKDGGHSRAATKGEEKAWYEKEEAILARFKADAPKRAAELKRFHERIRQDMGTA